MKNSIQVVTVTNRIPTEPYYFYRQFLKSLERFGVQPTVLGMNESWGGLMTKPRRLRQWLREHKFTAEHLIICDAWDIIFVQPPVEVFKTYLSTPEFENAVVFNAERACFPRGELSPLFPDPGTPWRYPNSGFMMGSAHNLGHVLESLPLDTTPDDTRLPNGQYFNPNDQEYYTFSFLKQPVKMVLDTRCRLCQACHGSVIEDFTFQPGKVTNNLTGESPGVLHLNGGSKDLLMPAILKHLGI